MARLPTLFLSHGAPDLLFSDGPARRFLEQLARELPRPRFIVVASAHWWSSRPAIDVSSAPRTIHDFQGFGPELAAWRYPARGSPEDARRAAKLLRAAGFEVDEVERGLDHGAWVPLTLVFPAADVTIFEVAIQPELGETHHLELGRALAPLAEEGGLLIGSGGATHNLARLGDGDAGFAHAFDDWLVERATRGDAAALVDFRARAPFVDENHPTDDHYLPLLVALGAAGPGARGRVLHRSFTYGTLSMTSLRFDAA